MARIGIIGLGVMGRPMAKNLAKAGHTVRAYRRGVAADADLESVGVQTTQTIADTVGGADAVITILPDSPDVLDVVLGTDGVFASAQPGLLYIDMSTISPQAAQQLAAEGAVRNIKVLDAPVSGGEKGAIDGSLSVMVGGDLAAFEEALPILQSLGTTIVHVGESGAGQTVEAANQLIVAANIAALAEAIVFLEASGVDPALALEALGGGLAGSTVLTRKGQSMLSRNFTPGCRIDLHHKDLGILTSAARAVGVPLPIGSAVTQLVTSLCVQGGGSLDHTALLSLVESNAGRMCGVLTQC